MSEPRVIKADYANWRPVVGRKVLQLVFEVPIEQTEQAMKMLGVPMPGESKWCAIALLENGKPANESCDGKRETTQRPSAAIEAPETQIGGGPSPTTAIGAPDGTSATQPKDRRPFASLPLSQQAALRCGDPQFKEFMRSVFALYDLADTAWSVRDYCNVDSRSKIVEGTEAAIMWRNLEKQFQEWLTDNRYAEARR